jgi:hypothetical protein
MVPSIMPIDLPLRPKVLVFSGFTFEVLEDAKLELLILRCCGFLSTFVFALTIETLISP